ncbi:hemolysin family protein [Paradesulfitobacterium aromaticivorans]
MLTSIFFLLILILLNAFFAASEIALISLNDNKVRLMAEAGDKKAKSLRNLLSEPSKFLATIQIGITFAGFLASAFAAESFADRLVMLMQLAGVSIAPAVLKVVAVTAITILLSYFTLVFGELVPKRLAMQKPEQISMLAVRPLSLLSFITSPFVKLLTLSTNFFIKLFGGNPNADEENVTEEEIRMMIEVGEERGTIQGTEKEFINNIFDFDDKIASDIMTHRTDIVGLPLEASLGDVFKLIRREKFSRIPVYQGNIDNIIGILHIKDLIEFAGADANSEFDLTKLIREPYFVTESREADELFKEMQRSKTHMAVVIDEYGGTSGIVTIEDLLEEIVGNIFDEYDDEEQDVEIVDDNTFIFPGLTDLDTVEKLLDVELPTEAFDTLGGFLMGQLGRVPGEEEKPVIEFNNVVFSVEDIQEKRISRVRASKGMPSTVAEYSASSGV